jgi:adenine-specific DNA-methyltransferase
MDKVKELGQVFTPISIVEQILDELDFTSQTYAPSFRILEPSFGEGVFLYEVIRRIAESGKYHNLSQSEISENIDNSVWGVEYDSELFAKVRQEIIDYVKQELGLEVKLPNLYRSDALDFKHFGEFDFVIGNPPYVRIHHMDPDMRAKVKEYEHSTGTTDLYIIFYELGLKWLNETGRLGYIAPNAWMKNASQSKFRTEIISSKVLKKVIDFGSKVIFPKIGTYTCITILDKAASHKDFVFSYQGDKTHFDVELDLANLSERAAEPLSFISDDDYNFVTKLEEEKKYLLGDKFSIQNGLATLGDKMFLFSEQKIKDTGAERALLRPVVKASRYKGEKVDTYMFFPYKEDENGRMVGYQEAELKTLAPNLYKYLLSIKADLEKRSLDSNSLWFWYGRSQAIQATNKEKLVFQPLVGPNQTKVNAFIVPSGTLVYSGLFIIENGGGKLATAKKHIENADFPKYIKLVGQDKSGGYKMMNSKNVKNFPIR